MTTTAEPKKGQETPRLGSLPPQFKFFLNPYTDTRFTTSCPGCAGRTKQRKLPLAIHVHGWGMVMLNKTCLFSVSVASLRCSLVEPTMLPIQPLRHHRGAKDAESPWE